MRKLLLLLVILTACSTNPVTGKKELHFISEQQEIGIGESNYFLMQQAQGGDYVAHQKVQDYVQKVGAKLAAVSDRPSLPYEFTVLNNSIPNAWALPGGKIAINRGLLVELDNEAELAAVLAHEIVHSAARHGAQNMERSVLMGAGILGLSQILSGHKYEDVAITGAVVGAGLTSLKYSRSAELEADKYGIKYMVAAGYDPEAAVTLQEKFIQLNKDKRSDWLAGLFATHPPSEERLEANKATVALYPKGGFLGAKEYQRMIAPLKDAQEAYENLDKGYEDLLRNKTASALVLAEEGIEIEPKEAHLYNLKGKACVKLRQEGDAYHSFTKAIALNPNYFDFYLQRGLLSRQLGDYGAAREDLDKSVELFPSDEGHYALGELALRQKNYPSAVYHFRIAAQAPTQVGNKARIRLREMNIQP